MDYERQSGDDVGTEASGSADEATNTVEASAEMPETDAPDEGSESAAAAAEAATGGDTASGGENEAATGGDTASGGETAATDATSTDTGTDFDSDADVMNDMFEAAPKPPEWPAADLERASESGAVDESDAPADTSAEDAIAATYAAATGEETDAGDDSDAPIHLEDAPAAEPARAENINLSQGGVQSIEATTVTLSQGGAGQVRADTMSIEQGGVGLARVKNLTLGAGSSAFAVVADQATVEEGSNTFLVVSRSFSGDVRPTIDWRGALAFGAALGFVLSLLRRRR